jgi:hypothetical protein
MPEVKPVAIGVSVLTLFFSSLTHSCVLRHPIGNEGRGVRGISRGWLA